MAMSSFSAPRLLGILALALLVGILCLHSLSLSSVRRTSNGIVINRRIPVPAIKSHVRPTASPSDLVVSVRFYGESMCPMCRKFVIEAWPPVWEDEGIRPHLDYDMISWGNAYFATNQCGTGPYSVDERTCWYAKCIPSSGSMPWSGMGALKVLPSLFDAKEMDDCFTGSVIYQHGEREGIIDIYETCIKEEYSLEDAVSFTYCSEGKIMDNNDLDAHQIMTVCTMALDNVDSEKVQQCYKTRGRDLEIANAKLTPPHPGVPYVLVDGKALEDPFDVKTAICERLKQKGMKDTDLPDSCRELALL
jgi:hypothetical protein